MVKLTGKYLWIAKNLCKDGVDAVSCSKGVGLGVSGLEAMIAFKNSKNISGVETANALMDKLTMSVTVPSGNSNLIAIPRGLALVLASSMVGMPPAFENLMVTLLGMFCKCAALAILAAVGDGKKVPDTRMPLL